MKTLKEAKTADDLKRFNSRTLLAKMRRENLNKKEAETISQIIEERTGQKPEQKEQQKPRVISEEVIRAKIDEAITDFLTAHKKDIVERVINGLSPGTFEDPQKEKRKKRVPATKLSESNTVKGMKVGSQVSFKVGITSRKYGGRRFKGFVSSIREKDGEERATVLTEEGYFDKKSSDLTLINI